LAILRWRNIVYQRVVQHRHTSNGWHSCMIAMECWGMMLFDDDPNIHQLGLGMLVFCADDKAVWLSWLSNFGSKRVHRNVASKLILILKQCSFKDSMNERHCHCGSSVQAEMHDKSSIVCWIKIVCKMSHVAFRCNSDQNQSLTLDPTVPKLLFLDSGWHGPWLSDMASNVMEDWINQFMHWNCQVTKQKCWKTKQDRQLAVRNLSQLHQSSIR